MFIILNANALSLHYGDKSIELTTSRHTTPSLNFLMPNGDIYYGALFDTKNNTPPNNTMHLKYNNNEYFLSPWCDAGYYPSPDTNECIPCGYGHYCTGGNHRESCTYGIIACNTINNTFDPPMPDGTENMYNRALTMDEVNQYVPITDFSNWKLKHSTVFNESIPCNESVNSSIFQEHDKEITSGTYLVMHSHCDNDTKKISAISGRIGCVSTAYIVIFDHNVIYRPVAICNNIGNYFDTSHIPYVAYDLRLPDNTNHIFPYASVNENVTNVNNINTSGNAVLYELK